MSDVHQDSVTPAAVEMSATEAMVQGTDVGSMHLTWLCQVTLNGNIKGRRET